MIEDTGEIDFVLTVLADEFKDPDDFYYDDYAEDDYE